MSVFSNLCLQARQLGASRLVFTADIFAESSPEGICGHWTCAGGSSKTEDALAVAEGRTGEEALRNLVHVLGLRRR